MTRPGRYPQELRERAVRLVFEHQDEHSSQWAAITSIAEKFGSRPRRFASGCAGPRPTAGSGQGSRPMSASASGARAREPRAPSGE